MKQEMCRRHIFKSSRLRNEKCSSVLSIMGWVCSRLPCHGTFPVCYPMSSIAAPQSTRFHRCKACDRTANELSYDATTPAACTPDCTALPQQLSKPQRHAAEVSIAGPWPPRPPLPSAWLWPPSQPSTLPWPAEGESAPATAARRAPAVLHGQLWPHAQL